MLVVRHQETATVAIEDAEDPFDWVAHTGKPQPTAVKRVMARSAFNKDMRLYGNILANEVRAGYN